MTGEGLHDEPNDATPLSLDEKDGLIPSHVTLRQELNELEQQNILEADAWVFGRKRNPVDEVFGKRLHKRMFGNVWSWAGTYRTSNKNFGVDLAEIQQRLYAALDNVRFWIEQDLPARRDRRTISSCARLCPSVPERERQMVAFDGRHPCPLARTAPLYVGA